MFVHTKAKQTNHVHHKNLVANQYLPSLISETSPIVDKHEVANNNNPNYQSSKEARELQTIPNKGLPLE
jgi:hypothetical protein